MKDQHEKIKDYRDLSQEEIDLINRIKEMAENVGKLHDDMMKILLDSENIDQAPDQRWLSIAKTDLQTGFMALTRSVAKPSSF